MNDSVNTIIQEAGAHEQLLQKFVSIHDGDVFTSKITLMLSKQTTQVENFLLKLKENLSEARITMPLNSGSAIIEGKYKKSPVFMWVEIRPLSTVIKFKITLSIINGGIELKSKILNSFQQETMPMVKWWFNGKYGAETRELCLPDKLPHIHPEYYPNLGDPIKYLDEFMRGSESVLVLAGPPGTGKTTLLRYLVIKHKLNVHVIYDEKLMETDIPFQSFLFHEEEGVPASSDDEDDENIGNDIMVIEDADTVISSRERDGNRLMSRFLNVSDGLIKLPNKKLVFTTNIVNIENVDPAILRPGRCFGVVHTRLLSFSEAKEAARVGGLPIPMDRREYALAELFNRHNAPQTNVVGFGIRH